MCLEYLVSGSYRELLWRKLIKVVNEAWMAARMVAMALRLVSWCCGVIMGVLLVADPAAHVGDIFICWLDHLLLTARWKVHSRTISLWDECYDVAE